MISDMTKEVLHVYGEAFVEAHRAAPGGLSLEVGTRQGGSALLFLTLLNRIYEGGIKPCLFTVDPYGYKPYDSGIPGVEPAPIYGDPDYLEMKQHLAPFAFHSHFKIESLDFFDRMYNCTYWHPGEEIYKSKTQEGDFALGQRSRMGNLTFCLLDGDHNYRTIASELGHLWGGRNALTGSRINPWMNPKGTVCVDNIDCDPKTKPFIEANFNAVFGPTWAIVKGMKA